MRLSISRRARTDLDAIWTYVAAESGSIDAANRLIASIMRSIYLLRGTPFLGRSRDSDLRPGLRSLPSGSYVIFYRVKQPTVRIVRVLHGARDAGVLLANE
jgi:toxin ParE1/3/4